MVVSVVLLMGVVQPAAAHDDVVHQVLIPNWAPADIGVIDSRMDTLVAHISVSRMPRQVVISDTLRKLVASHTENHTISIVDLKTHQPLATLPLDQELEHMAVGLAGWIPLVDATAANGTLEVLPGQYHESYDHEQTKDGKFYIDNQEASSLYHYVQLNSPWKGKCHLAAVPATVPRTTAQGHCGKPWEGELVGCSGASRSIQRIISLVMYDLYNGRL